jgi:hypothetical protein
MYQGRRLNVLGTVPALVMTAMLLACSVASAAGANLVFSYPNGFSGATGAFQTAANAASFSGATMQVTNGGPGRHEAGGVWYKAQQNITSFTTNFTFRIGDTGAIPSTIGMTFCIQNSNTATNPTASWGLQSGIYAIADANMAGYGTYSNEADTMAGIGKSVAIKFDISSNNGQGMIYPPGGSPNATGLYINGGPYAALVPENDLNPSGINLNAGHVMAATIVYDGSILTMTLLDTVTNAQFRTSWPIDIPSVVGGSSAWVGFTAGEIPAASNDVLSWSFSQGYNARLSTPTFSTAGGSYTSAQSVTISAPPGATIYYTTNGNQPTTSSSKYTGPISVNSSEAVQAVAIEAGYTDSFVATANYQIAPSGTPLINFPSGFAGASNLVTSVGTTRLSGTSIQLTDSNSPGQEVGAAWYVVPVSVTTFTTHYTVQFTSAQGQGMTFCIQNQNPTSSDGASKYVSGGPYALANAQEGLGYSGSTNGAYAQIAGFNTSLAVIFDLNNGSGNLTGLYTNGANPVGSSIDMSSSGVNLHNGHPLNVTLAYNGTTLALTVTDSVTSASFSHSWTINIPATVGGNTAYVGFTGSTGYAFANQYIQSWTYAASSGQTATAAVPAPPSDLRVQ